MARYVLKMQPYDKRGPFDELYPWILDREGRKVTSAEIPVGPTEVRKGVDVRDVGEAHIPVDRRKRLSDFLFYGLSTSVIFSSRVVQSLDAAGVVLDPALYRWPLKVVEPRTKKPWADYVILWPLKTWAVLDLARAEVDFYTGTDVIREVQHWVFDEAETPPYDLYATDYLRWIASEKLKAVVEREQFTGFSFRPAD